MKSNKFRTVSSKPKLSVHAKLPRASFHHIIGYVEGELNQYGNQTLMNNLWGDNAQEFQNSLDTVKQHLHQTDIPKISIVDSEVTSVGVVGDFELLISTATLRCWVESLLSLTKTIEAESAHTRNKYSSKHRECPHYRFAILKLLDIISFVKESSASVVTTAGYKKTHYKRDRYRYYTSESMESHNKRKHPFISKRYEKTTFYARAEAMYAGKFSDEYLKEWVSNLDFVYTAKGSLPVEVLSSELYLSHQKINL